MGLFLVFKGIPILFSIVAVSICIPTNSARGFPFLHTLSSIYCLYVFWWWPFYLPFSNNEQGWASFHVFISHLYVFLFLWRNVCLGLLPIFWLGCLFSWYWLVWAAWIFLKVILCQLFHLLLFFPILRVVFSPCL